MIEDVTCTIIVDPHWFSHWSPHIFVLGGIMQEVTVRIMAVVWMVQNRLAEHGMQVVGLVWLWAGGPIEAYQMDSITSTVGVRRRRFNAGMNNQIRLVLNGKIRVLKYRIFQMSRSGEQFHFVVAFTILSWQFAGNKPAMFHV
jgi:hypothetical protein